MYFVINLLILKCGSFCVPYTLPLTQTITINRVNDRCVALHEASCAFVEPHVVKKNRTSSVGVNILLESKQNHNF